MLDSKMAKLLNLYHRSPPALRTVMATARGLYLRWWRCNAKTDQLITEALERETWEPDQWQTWRDQRLLKILNIAATRVPYYKAYWDQRVDSSAWEKLENWPILKKDSIQKEPEAFIAEGISKKRLFELHTSGTTGKPLKLWRGRKSNISWYALCEARWRRWYDVSFNERWAILGGQLVIPFKQNEPPFWVWNAALKQLYMSSYHLALKNTSAYIDSLREHRINLVLGYASSLYSLALGLLEKGLTPPRLKVVLSNAEPLFEHQREIIRKAFKCPVRDSYGMTEIVAAASECNCNSLHLWPDAGIVEVVGTHKDIPVANGRTGRLVCTGLVNEEMPLIRYEVGDIGELASFNQRCGCGRTLPILQKIEGRMDDVVINKDGRRIGRLDPVFKGDFPVVEAQIIQENLDSLLVKYVPAGDFKESDKIILLERLKNRVGDMHIMLEPIEEIPRLANGKFRAVISKINHGDISIEK
jgi:phenylacetate-coenzyme A ligase PaaK-like adenylate-forming protein